MKQVYVLLNRYNIYYHFISYNIVKTYKSDI